MLDCLEVRGLLLGTLGDIFGRVDSNSILDNISELTISQCWVEDCT